MTAESFLSLFKIASSLFNQFPKFSIFLLQLSNISIR